MWEMVQTPEGIAIHDGEDCEGVRFRGVMGCRHSGIASKRGVITMTQALVRAEAILTPAPVRFNEEQMSVIKNTIAKGATDAELALFVSTCERTGLDPFMRQIYFIKRGNVGSLQVGIDGMRLIAERTDKYAGQDAPEWLDEDGVWHEAWISDKAPVAARVRVYRKDWPNHAAVGIARFNGYAQDTPLWRKMPDNMIAKCAEAQALRKAFPAEMSAIAAAVGSEYDPNLDNEGAVEVIAEELRSEDQKRPAPTRKQLEAQARAAAIEGEVVDNAPSAAQGGDTPAQRAEPTVTTAPIHETPPAPSEPPTRAITQDTQAAIGKVMADLHGSTDAAFYLKVYRDCVATFPEAVVDGRLRKISEMTEARGLEMLARWRTWQRGEDPTQAPQPEATDADYSELPEPEGE